ncbi:hypothetical protein LTR84_011327 [Exophiala bonariae]|uniref:F-box domain-containing protein n=1 Tax=Exophiala bonariae TaxID=1690606 RepID=A0AAV9MS33_9EURO|nr:hypothetical protein LTR84_011327 [Exophiala bonariae]
MDLLGAPGRSANSLGKRKWRPSPDDDISVNQGQSAPPWAGLASRTSVTPDGDATIKKPRNSATDLQMSMLRSSEDTLMHDQRNLADLPSEILQHIFSFVDPLSLGCLMCVNHSFHMLLDPAIPLPEPSGQVKILSLRRQDLIWAISRKTFIPNLPKPMDGATELDMWKLIRGHSCQFCRKRPNTKPPTLASAPWNAGPGFNGVRPIWPFRVRSCSSCLERKIIKIKESDLLLSSSNPSKLYPGLPFAFLTSTMDYVPSVVLQQIDRPPRVKLSKCYYIPQLKELELKIKDVEALGSAATEEWYKGLEEIGRQLNHDATRMDQWELQGGLAKTSRLELIEHRNLKASSHGNSIILSPDHGGPLNTSVHSKQSIVSEDPGMPSIPVKFQGEYLATGVTKMPFNFLQDRSNKGFAAPLRHPSSLTVASNPGPPHLPGSHTENFQEASRPLQASADDNPRPINRAKPGRTHEEAERMKGQRRKEIERRCQELTPPIMPATLEFMNAFQASLQISLPMDDNQWAILRPRLLAQRMEALQKQTTQEQLSQNPAMQLEEREFVEQEQRVAQENIEHMWTELKIPPRDKIGRYARNFVRNFWRDGNGVTKNTSSKFAAEVLCHIRQQFEEAIAQEDKVLELKGTAFPHDPASLALRKLNLEDMRWAFVEFVKPHTDKFGKELFLCSLCDNTQKLFSFESVIQHYAAKHTNQFSRGNAIVYWKADWPLDPPFDPSPNIPWIRDGTQPMAHIRMQGHYAQRAWTAPTDPAPTYTSSHQSFINEIVAFLRESWSLTDGIPNLPEALRTSVVVQLTCSRFSQKFYDDLDLHLFLNCVQNRPEVDFLLGITGLQCNVCSHRPEVSGWSSSGRSLPELLTHFQRTHIDFDASSHTEYGILSSGSRTSTSSTRLDWKRDMILVPSRAEIQAFLHSPTSDPQKVQIIADVLNAPAYTLPKRAGPSSQMSLSDSVHSPVMQQVAHLRPRSNHGSIRASYPSRSIARSEVSVPVSEDEYDPHRPGPSFSEARIIPIQSQAQVSSSARDHFRALSGNSPSLPLSEHREYPLRVHAEENRWGFVGHDRAMSGASPDRQSHHSSWTSGRDAPGSRHDLPIQGPRSVDSRPGSKMTSHHTLQRPASDVPITSSTSSTQTFAAGQPGSNTAVSDFLNSFDPTVREEDSNSESAISRHSASLRRLTAHEYAAPRHVFGQGLDLAYASAHEAARPGFERGHSRPDTLPVHLQEDRRFGVSEADYQTQIYVSTPRDRLEEHRHPRSIIRDHGHVDDVSRTHHRTREEPYTRLSQEQFRKYQEAEYERNAYREERFAPPISRYEVVAQPPMEFYHQRPDQPAERFVESHRLRQQIASDRDEYMRDTDGHILYVPVDRKYYEQTGEPGYTHPTRDRQSGYTNYNDAQYVRQGTSEAGLLSHSSQRDSRPRSYRPDDETRPYMTG